MKILMFGRGVISTQYGWAFEKAGHTVDFFVRKGRKSEYGPSVTLNIIDGRSIFKGISVNEKWPINMIEDFSAANDYDLIIVSVQHYHIKNVVDFLAERVGKSTILMFNNFWSEPKEAVSALPFDRLVWGFPGAGGGFDSKGVLNGGFLGQVYFGTFGTESTKREIEVRKLFISNGFKVNEQKDFRSWLLVHFAMDAVFQLEILKTGTGGNGFTSYSVWKNVILNLREISPLLQARGIDLKNSPELNLLRMPAWLISLAMKITLMVSPPVKRIIESHSNTEEIKSFCRDVLETAHEMKISLPRFEESKKIFE